MKRIAVALALLPALPAFAAEGDLCPVSSGQFVTTFYAKINDGSGDSLLSDGKFNLRVPADLNPPVKYSGGLKELGISQQAKFNTIYQDANGYCIATKLEVRPADTSTSGGGSKLRGGDSRP